MKNYLFELILVAIIIFILGIIVHSRLQNQNSISAVSSRLITVEHDGHTWVMPKYRGSAVHHPDCECKQIRLD